MSGGVDEIFRRRVDDGELMRVRYRYNLPVRYILTVGTWEPRKNLIGLFQAWDSLKARAEIGDYKLVVAGMKGWRYGAIEREINARAVAGGVKAIGYIVRSDLPAVYQGAALFVFPSFYEGQGLPPLEAQASGVPVAASKVSSLPEVLGGGALYFDPNQPREIADAIVAILNNPGRASQLREEGKKQAEKYTWERTAQETLEVYREACGLGGSAG